MEPPSGIKANLKRIYNELDDSEFDEFPKA